MRSRPAASGPARRPGYGEPADDPGSDLIVVGANDTPILGASDYIAKRIPNAHEVLLPDAAHRPNLDQPQSFHAALAEFLTDLPD